DDFYYEVEDSEIKLMKETTYELLKNNQKKKLGKNNETKMTLYNAIPRKEYEMIDLLTQEYEKFSISNEETIDSSFTRFNAIMTSLKSLDPDYSSKNHVRKFLRALPFKWKAKEKTSDDSDSQGGSDEDIDEEEEAEAFNLIASNFSKFFRKSNRFGRRNRFGNRRNRFGKDCGNSLGNKGGESSKQKEAYGNRRGGIEGHFASECRKPKENKAFVRGAWSDSEDGDEPQNDAASLMAIDSQEDTLKHKAYICLNKENNEIKESLNVTFDESLPKPKSPPSVEDDRIDEPIVQDLNGSPSLQVNVSNESYPKSLKEAIVPKHQVDSHMGKISHELEEPIRSAHVDESVCCQVQHMMKESIYALRKEMCEIQTLINNYLKVLTVVIEDIARVFLQDTNEE
ncbi:hypothetical protein Tco_0047717, partial [Tanacetum coccineum]